MSSICSEFVQNAWKKDLCSNCFKAKADHITSQTVTVGKESFLVQGDGGPPINERQTSQILISTVDSTKMNLEINNGISPASPFKAAGLSASGCSHNKSHSTIITSNNNNVDDVVIANNQLNSCGNPRFIKNKSSSTLNGNGHPSLRKIGSSGVHLWEVGHLPEKHSLAESTPVLNGVKDETECKAEQDSTPSFNGTTSVENDHKSVPGILKEKSGLANGSSKGRLHFGIGSERRGSVGFINESPLVIGYGGNDYEWDDQDSVEDEPSDLDSLEESFEMSEEDRAFCQLTDRNTEYNSDNTNLLTTLEHRSEHHSLPDGKLKPVPNGRIFHRVRSEVDLKLNKHLPEETETPSDVIKKSGRPSLIESDETRFDYLENDEAGLQCEDNLNDGAVTEETMHSSFTKDNGEDKMHNTVASLGASANVAVYRPGSETVPSRKYPSTPRASVMRLFSEEPVTSAEFKAAIDSTQPLTLSRGEQDVLGGRVDTSNGPSFIDEKPDTSGREDFHCLPNANRHHVVDNHDGSECSPYDVVPLSSLKREKDCSDKTYCSSQAPTIPLCPPPSANDDSQKFPLSTKLIKPPGNTFGLMSNRFQSHVAISKQNSGPEQASPPKNYSSSGRGEPKSTVGVCSTFCSPAKNDSTDPRFWNREYASVNYSCHYAASYISTGVNPSTLPSDGVSGKIGGAALSDLPPTPLTNPYSSTAILKGIPQQRDASVEQSPQKPPVTKPKPKLPLKPVGQPKSFDDCISLVRDSDSGGEKNARSDDASVGASLHDTKGAHFQALTGDNNDAAGETIVANTSESSLCYPEISDSNELQMSVTSEEALASECDTVEQQKCLSTFESKVATLSSSLDFSKRTPKRQAPRPPTGTQESPSQFTKNDRSSTGVPDDHADHHLLVSAHKVASSMSMDRCASSSKVYNDIGTPHTFDRRSSPSNRTVPNADSGLPHNQGSSHVGSSALTSTYALNGAPYDSSQRIHSKEVSHKEGKLKKSKFSLKKLWKFGTKDDGEDSSKLKGKILHFGNSQQQERRGKLEILHPIDLINASTTQPNELSNVTPTPGLSVDRRSEVSMTSSLNGRDEMSTSTGVGTIQRAFPKEEIESSEMIEDHCDVKDEVSRCKPPPPPRSRSHGEEHMKDKPNRPPPPTKTKQQELYGSQDDVSDPAPILRRKNNRNSPLIQEQRNSYYSSTMEYANLGDVRNTLTPKKPGRCPSNSMIDITYGQHMNSSASSECQDESDGVTAKCEIVSATEKFDATYYEPPINQIVENAHHIQMHGDQVKCSDQSVNSSSVNQSLSSMVQQHQIAALTDVPKAAAQFEQHSKNNTDSSGKSDGKKIYERVVLKKGNLEKVYAKLPVAPLDPTDSGVPSTMISDVDEVESGTVSLWPRRKSSRLSLRKAKTVVHKNLEDNYGAVVTANHQTLTQILEQVSLTQPGMASKARLLEEVPPHWSDFKLLEDCQVTMVGGKAFFSAVWQQNVDLTLMASQEPLCVVSQSTRNPCVLTPFVEFEDAIPSGFFVKSDDASSEMYCNGTIWVLERMRVETLTSVAESLHLQRESDMESYEREVCFILLQMINCLKHLQVLGIEEMDATYDDFAMIMKNNDANYRLVILPQVSSVSDGYRTLSSADGSREKLSLCQSAVSAMMLLLNVDDGSCRNSVVSHHRAITIPSVIPLHEAFCKIADILQQERATSLSQAKLLLEYLLWGPSDLQGELQPNSNCVDQEQAYQRWLDLERATVLNNLIRTQSLWQIRLTVFEEYMLSFLVRTCAKTLREASNHLQMNRTKLS